MWDQGLKGNHNTVKVARVSQVPQLQCMGAQEASLL